MPRLPAAGPAEGSETGCGGGVATQAASVSQKMAVGQIQRMIFLLGPIMT